MGTRSDREIQRAIRWYKEETGIKEIDMRKVVDWAVHNKGWPLPKPIDPIDQLARRFSRAARQEIRHHPVTGNPYRVNHALKQQQGGQQLTFWISIEEAPRPRMLKSMVNHREQVLGELVQMSFDEDYWNSIHPKEEPINLPKDFTDEIEWRKNADDEHKKAS